MAILFVKNHLAVSPQGDLCTYQNTMSIPVRIASLEKCRQLAVAHRNVLRQALAKDYMQHDTRRTADARSGSTCQSGGEAQGFNHFLKRHTYQITTQVYDL